MANPRFEQLLKEIRRTGIFYPDTERDKGILLEELKDTDTLKFEETLEKLAGFATALDTRFVLIKMITRISTELKDESSFICDGMDTDQIINDISDLENNLHILEKRFVAVFNFIKSSAQDFSIPSEIN